MMAWPLDAPVVALYCVAARPCLWAGPTLQLTVVNSYS